MRNKHTYHPNRVMRFLHLLVSRIVRAMDPILIEGGKLIRFPDGTILPVISGAAGADTGILELPFQASATVTKKRFVVLTGDQTVARSSVAGALALGVAMVSIEDKSAAGGINEITSGKGTAVHVHGVVFVESGAAIVRLAEVTNDNVGRGVTAATGDVVHGRALKAASAAGQLIPVLLAGTFGPVVP